MIRSELALALVLLASPAWSAPTAVEKSTADALFKEGKKLMEAKDWDAACPKLVESAKLQPGGGVQLALAICHESQGRLATAVSDYREALALAKRDKRKDREDIASKKVAELEPRLAKLTVTLSEAARAQSPSIRLDDAALPAASFGVAIPVDRGVHLLVVSAAGKKTQTVEITVKDGEAKQVTVAPLEDEAKPVETPVEKPVVVAPPPVTKKEGPSRVGPLVVGGLGVVFVGVGAYFGARAMSLGSDVRTNCPGGSCSSPDWVSKNDDAHRAALISDVGVGVGALAIAGAIVWWVATPSETPVAVAVGPRSLDVVVRW